MHYVISYDLANDRKRGKVAKILQRHGCERLQRSVFVAHDLHPDDLRRLWADLAAAVPKPPPGDSIVLLPLRETDIQRSRALGDNTIFTLLAGPPTKIIL